MKNIQCPKLLSKQDLCILLGLSSRDISRFVRSGRIPVALKVTNKTMFFDPSVIENFKSKQVSNNE